MARVPRGPLAALAVTFMLAGGCGTGTEEGEAGIRSVLDEFSIDLERATVPSGPVSFQISNEGAETHEFSIVATDLSEHELPILEREPLVVGVVDENAPELTFVGEIKDLKPGSTTPFEQELSPGSYVIICNIISHYERGMHAPFTVE